MVNWRSLVSISLVLVFLALGSSPALAFDEFADHYSPTNFILRSKLMTLVLKGELEFEFHDLEGAGGPGHDSPTDTKTIGTRSPFVEIDSFWLAMRMGFSPSLALFSVLDYRSDSARVGAAWIDFRPPANGRMHHHFEAGYHTPLIKLDRRTERYPLIGTAYWRQPELHLAYEGAFKFSESTAIEAGLSLAMMRPLTLQGVQESTSQVGTINILSCGPASVYSGNSPVGGAYLKARLAGLFLEGFGFWGQLSNEAGTDVLRSAFPNYRYLPAYNEGEADQFYWYGARLGLDRGGLHLLVEGIASQEGLLTRAGGYAQASFSFPLPMSRIWFHHIEPLVRLETFRIMDSATVHGNDTTLRSTAPANAASWDWDVATLALIMRAYRDLVTLRIEYYLIREQNGIPDLGIEDEPLRNNELMVQAEFRF